MTSNGRAVAYIGVATWRQYLDSAALRYRPFSRTASEPCSQLWTAEVCPSCRRIPQVLADATDEINPEQPNLPKGGATTVDYAAMQTGL
jgi:hypothetical protein